jgi:predicted HicB family RNase H-like nuclease
MSDQKKRTGSRNIRISDEVWEAAQARAALEGTTLSALIRQWVADYAGLDPGKTLVGGRKIK